MPESPFFSVVIPAYNVATYIDQTLQSVWDQTYDDYEVIVINDGSTDLTLARLQAHQKTHDIKIIDSPNGGVSCARNLGIAASCGQYIAFLDSDDIWMPWHLEWAKDFFTQHAGIEWYSSVLIPTDNIPSHHSHNNQPPRFIVCNYFENGYFHVSSTTVIIKRLKINTREFFPVNIPLGEDMIAWTRFAAIYEKIGINLNPTAYYRQRIGSAMSLGHASQKSEQQRIREDIDLLKEFAISACDKKHSSSAKRFFYYQSLIRWSASIRRMSQPIYIDIINEFGSINGIILNSILIAFTITQFFNKILFYLPLKILIKLNTPKFKNKQ